MIYRRLFRVLVGILCLGACISCGRDVGHAKSDLLKLNYQFKSDDFVRAARAGDEKAVELFLDAGMDVNATNTKGETALLAAAENDSVKIIQILGKRKVAYDLKDNDGWTPFMKAVYGNRIESTKALAEYSREDLNRGLLLASLLGHVEVAGILLKNGAEVDTAGSDGMTPLLYARKANHAALEKLLLEAGADPQATALRTAVVPTSIPIDPGVPPTPATALLAREILLKDPKTIRNSPEEAWWKKYGLDLNDSKTLSQDNDGDGFTNSEEFLADSSPIDPSVHPPSAGKLVWDGYHRESLPYFLQKVDGGSAVLVNSEGIATVVKPGEAIGDWKVLKVRNRKSFDKDGHPYDGSDVTVVSKTGEKIRLVPGISGPSTGSYASVILPSSNEAQRLRTGEEFSLPNDGTRRYLVVDVREEQVVLKELKTGETFTVSKR